MAKKRVFPHPIFFGGKGVLKKREKKTNLKTSELSSYLSAVIKFVRADHEG